MQEIRSSNPPVVTEICDPNKFRARHHRRKAFSNESLRILKFFGSEKDTDANTLKPIMLPNGIEITPEEVLKSTQSNCSCTTLLVLLSTKRLLKCTPV